MSRILRFMPTALLLCALILCAVWLLLLRANDLQRAIGKYMHGHEIGNNFSGTVLVSRDGHVVFDGAYGYANVEKQTKNTIDTKFEVGSITKSFTAILILMLQEQGLLSVEDKICRFIDDCPAHWQSLTLHHLLSHSSGIFNFTEVDDLVGMMAVPPTEGQVIDSIRHKELQFEPGSQYEYSNSNYHILGLIIERATGRSYAEVLKERILTRLAMNNSGYGIPSLLPFGAIGYRSDEEGRLGIAPVVDIDWYNAAGGIYSTVNDLMIWSRALSGSTLLSNNSKAQMWTPNLEDYGYGWLVQRSEEQSFGRLMVMHNGATLGFRACFNLFPEDKLTTIALSNDMMTNPCRITRDLSAIIFGEHYTTPIARRAIYLDEAILDRYIGNYQFDEIEELSIKLFREEDRMYALPSVGEDRMRLFPETETEFFFKTIDAQVTFRLNGEHEVVGFLFKSQGRSIQAIKTALQIDR